MSLNYPAIFGKIQELARSDRAVSECMGEVITVCSRDIPHGDWSRLSALDYNGDAASLTSWIGDVFEKHPAPFHIQGLWIGICNPSQDGKVWADMYVGALAQYAADDKELGWLSKAQRHYPEDA